MSPAASLLRTAAVCSAAAWLGVTPATAEPVVSSAVASQRTDGSQVVDIAYALAGATTATRVAIQVSTDDGASWTIAPAAAHVSGDVGATTTDGAKTIAYHAGADLPRTSTSLARAKVIAIDGVFLPGNVPLELAGVPPGTFTMGSPDGELSRLGDESTFSVQLTQGFFMGRTEVTQKQWFAVMGAWPGTPPSAEYGLGDNHPVYWVTWNEAQDFTTSLTAYLAATGQGPATVRLPTEAEWEYSCRAGTTTRFSFGDGFGADEDCSAEEERVNHMWYCGNNGAPEIPAVGTRPVGQKTPNPFGLYDMHGNVVEWCRDLYDAYPVSPPTRVDPVGPLSGTSYRVLRGGCWSDPAWLCRSAQRRNRLPTFRSANYGFRVLVVR